MIKKINFFILAIITLLNSAILNVYAQEENNNTLEINAKSAILIEQTTGEVLYEFNADERLSPASVTKVMTLYLIYEAVASGKISWEDKVTTSEYAASMGGSQIFLEAMEQQTVEDMTKSIAIASANDAAVAMAEFIGGTEQGFVNMMNQKAKELGMENTNFENACGLDLNTTNHYMSARDIAIISRALLTEYPEVTKFTTTWQDTITHSTSKGETEFGLTNTNKLLKWYDGATGLKTGSTEKALYCLSGSATRNGTSLIAVVMAAPDPKVRFQEVMTMLDYGFANYEVLSTEDAGKVVGTANVYKGKEETVNAVVENAVSIVIKKGNAQEITSNINIVEGLKAPIEQGSKIGEIIYFYDGEEVGRSNLIAEKTIEKSTLSDTFMKLILKWFT